MPSGSVDPESDRLRILVAMGYEKGGGPYALVQLHGDVGLKRIEYDVFVADELIPGSLR